MLLFGGEVRNARSSQYVRRISPDERSAQNYLKSPQSVLALDQVSSELIDPF